MRNVDWTEPDGDGRGGPLGPSARRPEVMDPNVSPFFECTRCRGRSHVQSAAIPT